VTAPYVLRDGLVVLREWNLADAAWYAEQSRDPETQKFTNEPPDLTEEQVRAAIASLPDRTGSVGRVICERGSGQRVGNIALAHAGEIGEISYWVAPAGRGRGMATAAVRLLSEWALGPLGLSEIRLWTRDGNVGSQRVALRCGYRRVPRHDKLQEVRGATWAMLAFTLTARP